MAKFAVVAIVLLASAASQARRTVREASSAQPADANATAIADILQKISSGESGARDDARLVEIIKQEIARTAKEIETPAGSIEAAARKAQRLVSELTSAYTSAIYKSESPEEARDSFVRFQSTVREIVEFIKNGQFLT